MTSKRSSRAYVDEAQYQADGYPKAAVTSCYGSRRDSRGSIKDDLVQLVQEMDDGQRNGVPPRDASSVARSVARAVAARDAMAATTRMVEKTAAAPPATMSDEYPAAPVVGRPVNFGVVVPGVYRSSYPKPDDYDFLRSLRLKTVVTLVKKDELDHALALFTSDNGIRQVVFNMKGTKKEAIPATLMAAILQLVMDKGNYPLLVHCNHGKHRTGCVVAVVRKFSGWDLDHVLDEYRTFASPKVRECDLDYINAFESSALALARKPARFTPQQTRTFFRALLFSTLIMVLWLVSGTHMTYVAAH
ncbi:hypothetical protein RJ55_06690 [Drechmeria coniospora]|nr:hypothetical protein RJ55_06690 [Drechmeria coniospora]